MHELFRISELESQLHTKTSTEGVLQQQQQEHEAKIEELEESLAKVEAALKQAQNKGEVSVIA